MDQKCLSTSSCCTELYDNPSTKLVLGWVYFHQINFQSEIEQKSDLIRGDILLETRKENSVNIIC